MAYGTCSLVAWGLVLPQKTLYPLLKSLRKYGEEPLSDAEDSSNTETSKAAEEAQGPPVKKRKLRRFGDAEMDELVELMEAAIEKADDERAEKEKAEKEKADEEKAEKGEEGNESPEKIPPYLQEIIMVRRVIDKRAGRTITCYYSRKGLGEKDEYRIEEWGYPRDLDVDYDLKSFCVGEAFSLERIMKDVPEGTSDRLREALHFKEAGIEVEDQWIQMMECL